MTSMVPDRLACSPRRTPGTLSGGSGLPASRAIAYRTAGPKKAVPAGCGHRFSSCMRLGVRRRPRFSLLSGADGVVVHGRRAVADDPQPDGPTLQTIRRAGEGDGLGALRGEGELLGLHYGAVEAPG